MDSGAFTEIATHGHYRAPVAAYAAYARRWQHHGQLAAVVSQDWMCEGFILRKTGLTVADHQRLTIERYDALLAENLSAYILPVLQGYRPDDYRRHLDLYGDRLSRGAWVGVGSLCKRNGAPDQTLAVLTAVHAERPDLRLHGFGLKLTALAHPGICEQLHSADSMAWSYHARKNGRSANNWREAKSFSDKVEHRAAAPSAPYQASLGL